MDDLVLSPQDWEFLYLIRELLGALIEVEVSNSNVNIVRMSIPESLDIISEPSKGAITDQERQLITLIRSIGYGKLVVQIEKGEIRNLPWRLELKGSFRTVKLGLLKKTEDK